MKKKVWLVRIDKMGDLILTLPVDQLLNPETCEWTWIIRKGWADLAKMADPPRKYYEVETEKDFASLFHPTGSLPTADSSAASPQISFDAPDAIVFFYAPSWAYKVAWKKRIPFRAGRRSSLASFLTLNKGVRQKRHLSEQSEFIYNLELLRPLFQKFSSLIHPLWTSRVQSGETSALADAEPLRLIAPEERRLLEKFAVRSQDFVIVHPGMAGSALNWPTENYRTLIEKLAEKTTVMITGTRADAAWTRPLHTYFARRDQSRLRWAIQDLHLRELAFLISRAKAVIAPSTGVLHLAASLGVRSVGIYSSVLAHHPRRWAARGKDVRILVPEREMSEITVEHVLEALRN